MNELSKKQIKKLETELQLSTYNRVLNDQPIELGAYYSYIRVIEILKLWDVKDPIVYGFPPMKE